ncbi:MAG: sigma-54-dependent Fis family transcriptional regulator [Rhodospirillales bacterium]|nr:sigma-54-dependent Fis family transcriptional regulator [Rhodospirillales bacterium]
MTSVLIVDDQIGMCESLEMLLRMEGFDAVHATEGSEAVDLAARLKPDVVITDMSMQPMGGIDVLAAVKSRSPLSEVIVMTAYGTIDSAVSAMRLGAFDYITKPFKNEAILAKVRRAAEKPDKGWRGHGIRILRGESKPEPLVAASRRMKDVLALAERLAATNMTILITGETGTGKNLVARHIHHRSPRGGGPFVNVSCAALPESLLESELFGHEKGAFTGAAHARRGLFEEAMGGTIFLDEVGLLPASQQPKLLCVLEDRTIRPVGGNRNVAVDVRIVAATNVPLDEQVGSGRFREDLFFRLNAANICVPPLRERREDIPALIAHFLDICRGRSGRQVAVSDEAMERLVDHNYPGNIRELENAIDWAAAIAATDVISPSDLPAAIQHGNRQSLAPTEDKPDGNSGKTLNEIAKNTVLECVARHHGNLMQAARELGISRTTLWRRLREYREVESRT